MAQISSKVSGKHKYTETFVRIVYLLKACVPRWNSCTSTMSTMLLYSVATTLHQRLRTAFHQRPRVQPMQQLHHVRHRHAATSHPVSTPEEPRAKSNLHLLFLPIDPHGRRDQAVELARRWIARRSSFADRHHVGRSLDDFELVEELHAELKVAGGYVFLGENEVAGLGGLVFLGEEQTLWCEC